MSIKEYIEDTKGELKHVNWPNRRQTMQLTMVVISISLATALFLFLFDFLFLRGLGLIISR